MARTEVRLGIAGRTLVFPDGKPFCLGCGRRPVALRAASFRDVDYADRRAEGLNLVLNRIHPLLGWANRTRYVSVKVDVPVCWRHVLKGRALDLAAVALAVAAIGTLLYLGLTGVLPRRPGEMGQVLKAGLLASVVFGGWFTWRYRSKAPLLPCSVRRESPDRLVFDYPDGLRR